MKKEGRKKEEDGGKEPEERRRARDADGLDAGP